MVASMVFASDDGGSILCAVPVCRRPHRRPHRRCVLRENDVCS